jgi:hypothetical protein
MRAPGTGTNGQLSKTQFLYGKISLCHVDASVLNFMEDRGIYNVYQFLEKHCYLSLYEVESISDTSRREFLKKLRRYNLINDLRIDGKSKRTRGFAERILSKK